MPTFTGTGANDRIYQGYISSGVLADPAGYTPSSASDTIYGNGGNDSLDGSGGNDSVFGGAGDDTAFGGAGNDFMDDYTASSFGGNDSMDGGSGNDTLYGYDGNDALLGGDGADFLYGEDGYDLLNGGTGADTMTGGVDGDTYYVDDAGDAVVEMNEYGIDQVYSGATFTLGAYVERLELTGRGNISGTGNASDNAIFGNEGSNVLTGLEGDDGIHAGGGADTVDGGTGADSLFGGAGNDSILGGADADYLGGEAGADTLVGGSGNDTYEIDGADTVVESAGGGIDTIYTSANWALGAEFENLTLAQTATGYGNDLNNVMDANWSSGTLYGLGGNDTLLAGWNATLVGGTGDDKYVVETDESVILETAGGGIDTVEVNFDYNYYYSDQHIYVMDDNVENAIINDYAYYYWYYSEYIYEDSTLTGNASANRIEGGEGDNTLLGMNGADTIYGNGGDDTFDGGAGTDRFDGGEGSDWVIYTSNTTPVKVDLLAGQVSFPGQSSSPEAIVSIENARTGSGNDIFIGNDEANRFSGNAGNDTFDGGGGQDYFLGGGGVDTILYTSSSNSVNVDLANGHASISGQPTEDFDFVESASTGSGADTVTGSSAANELHGGGGADHLRGAGGADKLVGGGGNDTFHFAAGDSTPGSRDQLLAGDGATAFDKAGKVAGDTIDVSAIDANTTAGGNQAFIWGGTGKGHLWATNSGNLTVIHGNTDGDAAAEFEVAISDANVKAAAYTAADFLL